MEERVSVNTSNPERKSRLGKFNLIFWTGDHFCKGGGGGGREEGSSLRDGQTWKFDGNYLNLTLVS